MKKIALIITAICIAVTINAQELTILHWNDTHSHADPNRGGDSDGLGGVIECAAYVDSVRAEVGKKNLLLLHAGDFGQGTSYFTVLNGDMEIELMNELGIDVSALGNHEFDNGPEDLARRLKDAKFEVVCANYDFSNLGGLDKYVQPYTIVKKAGKKIGIIGLLVDVTTVVDRDIADNMTYLDPIEQTNKYAKILKEEKGCDIVIVLSHLGTVGRRPCDTDIAAECSNIDYVIGGHSHTFLEEPIVVHNVDGHNVPVVTTGCYGIYTGELKIK